MDTKPIKILNPMVDSVFKKIFGENEKIFIDFVNSTFADRNEMLVKSVKFLNTEVTKDIEDAKECRLDVLAEMEDKSRINIEIQIAPEEFFAKRSLFYWSKIYTDQLEEGDSYKQLRKCICINILNFNLFSGSKECHSMGQFIDLKQGVVLSPELEVHFLELTKLNENAYNLNAKLVDWLLFLKEPKPKILKELTMKDPILGKAVDTLFRVSQDPKERMIYEARMKAWRDKVTALEVAEERGEAKGEARGEAKGRTEGKTEGKTEVARNLKKAGVAIEMIMQVSGFSREEIEKL